MKDILHCDLNNFYASVECRDDPSLSGKPVAVCGSVEDRSGIVLAKNYLAKSYGVKTAEAIWEAKKKCPHLVIVSPHFEKYSAISKQVRGIYARYTDLVEPFGMDECWLDITGSHYLFGKSEEIAHRIRREVREETGLTISVGVSFTKVLAKLGSDLKKPDAVTLLTEDVYRERIKRLDVSELIGIGPATQKRLNKLRIYTLGELAQSDPEILMRNLGKSGVWLWRAVNGYDDEIVHEIGYDPTPKSVGNSTTLPFDLHNNAQVWQVMLTLAEEVCRRMRKDELMAGGVCISVKTNDLEYREYQVQLDVPMSASLLLAQAGFKLFLERFDWHLPIRAVGIRGINLVPADQPRQCSIFSDTRRIERQETLGRVSDSLRQRFGKDIIYPARVKENLEMTHEKICVFGGMVRR